MALAPERQRKVDYNRWRLAQEARKVPPKLSKVCKRMKYTDWYDDTAEEHY